MLRAFVALLGLSGSAALADDVLPMGRVQIGTNTLSIPLVPDLFLEVPGAPGQRVISFGRFEAAMEKFVQLSLSGPAATDLVGYSLYGNGDCYNQSWLRFGCAESAIHSSALQSVKLVAATARFGTFRYEPSMVVSVEDGVTHIIGGELFIEFDESSGGAATFCLPRFFAFDPSYACRFSGVAGSRLGYTLEFKVPLEVANLETLRVLSLTAREIVDELLD